MKQKALKLICALLLFFCAFTAVKAEEVIEESTEEINTLYEEYFDTSEFPSPGSQPRRRSRSAQQCTSVEEAAALLREQMKLRSTEVTVPLNIPRAESGAETAAKLAFLIFHAAYEHTGVSTEGDYLRYHYLEYKCNMKYLSDEDYYNGTFTYTVTYMTDMAMEDEVTAYLQDVYEELGLSEHTQIEKIRRIYAYICSHTEYDDEHDSSYKLKYSAYAALISGKAVCQGYAALFYRMALDNGLECRVINGKAGSVNHAWNSIRLGDSFYLLDATWDAGRREPDYFLLCEDDLTAHYKNTELFGPDFDAQYPPASESYVKLEGIAAEDTVYYYGTGTVPVPIAFDPADATVRSLQCTSDDETVIAVRDNMLSLLQEGSTDIHVRTDDGYYTADIRIVITFDTYDLTVKGGSGSGQYHDHEEVTVSAETPAGFRFVRWDADFETDADLTEETLTFRMPAGTCTLEAVFEEIPEEPGWKKDSRGWKYLNDDGTYASGWQRIDDSWYRFGPDTYMCTGWLKYKDNWYYLKKSGAMHTGWGMIGGSWYYFRDSGAMHRGWLNWNDKWYFLKQSGRMASGWLENNGHWFFLRESGSMMTEWAKIRGSWYYFRSSGAMHSGWVKWKGRWFFLRENGKMVTGAYTIGKKEYSFAGSGILVK
ncbi:MAG: hypothetical protein K6G61_03465 [Solobacterium sp.]|nr:hypothetical protein [Solobacterium sp.]